MALGCGRLEFGDAASLIPRNAPEAQHPTHRSGHRSYDVTADAASQVSVVATGIGREQLAGPGRCLLGVTKRGQIALFDERGKVGAQAIGKRHRQQRVAVPSVAAQLGPCQVFSAAELLLETCALSRVGFILLPRVEDRVALVELCARRVGTVELDRKST